MADEKHVGNPKKELKEAFEDAASKAPPGGSTPPAVFNK